MNLDVFAFTNRGGREYNEDSIVYEVNGDSGLFVVADGLGGHEYGELASKCVCDILKEEWNPGSEDDLRQWFETVIKKANEEVLCLQREKTAALKSTVVALVINDKCATWANSGDSRLYYIHNNELDFITNDHSVAYKKYKVGEISRDDIRTDDDQSSLLRTIGNEERFEPEIYRLQNMESGDAFLLCSDGVWEYFSDGEILIDLLKSKNSKEWAEYILLRLMDRIDGTNDNLSLITIFVD